MGRYRTSLRLLVILVLVMLTGTACNLSTETKDLREQLHGEPLVVILVPLNGSMYAEGAQVELVAIAQDANGGVARVEFRMDAVVIGEVMASPPGQATLLAQVSWTATGQRKHLLTVEAFRPDGSSLGFQDVVLEVVASPGGEGITRHDNPDPAPGEQEDVQRVQHASGDTPIDGLCCWQSRPRTGSLAPHQPGPGQWAYRG